MTSVPDQCRSGMLTKETTAASAKVRPDHVATVLLRFNRLASLPRSTFTGSGLATVPDRAAARGNPGEREGEVMDTFFTVTVNPVQSLNARWVEPRQPQKPPPRD